MKWLIEGDNDKDVSVLPIVGLGGLGKATLVNFVYNDEKIKKHFKIQMWICVGEVFDVKDVARVMLKCGMREQCTFSRLEDMRPFIQEKLANKRYLLILDDVWSEDASKWETLKNLLRLRSHGNKIVVTTRSQRVTEIMGTVESPYNLQVLTDGDCWMLFKQRAFGKRRAQESSNLVQIGKEIVGKCGGLPLAAKSFRGLMVTKQTEADWLAIRNNKIWRLNEGTVGILPALQLSYVHVSPQLKQCFIYCSVFQKDYLMKRLELIRLWIAQRFIQQHEGMQLEDIGNSYFNSLLGRSFFQNERKDDFGNIVSCQMHHLIHDLACFVAQDESSILEIDENINFPPGCGYSSMICHDGSTSTITKVACEEKKLRLFFLLFGTSRRYDHPENYIGKDDLLFSKAISNLIHLWALRLDCLSNRNIVSVAGKLKHLRFLELLYLQAEVLPNSITDLYNLQTLNLHKCFRLIEFTKRHKDDEKP